MKIPDAKQGMETILAWNLGEGRSKEVILKILLDGVWFPDLLVGELMSCLVPSLPPRLNLLSLVPEYTPTTPLKWLLWLTHCFFLVLVVQSPVMGSRVFVTILCMLLVFVWAQSKLVHTCRLAFARAQRRLRLTMQHVYGHSGNFGNECADHAAALGTFGLISNHNVATRWIRHNFDASVCFDGCDNISEVLERLRHIRTNATSLHQDRG